MQGGRGVVWKTIQKQQKQCKTTHKQETHPGWKQGSGKWFAFSLCLLRRLPQRRRRHVNKFGEIQSTEHSKNLGFNSVGSGQVKKMVPRKVRPHFIPTFTGPASAPPPPRPRGPQSGGSRPELGLLARSARQCLPSVAVRSRQHHGKAKTCNKLS